MKASELRIGNLVWLKSHHHAVAVMEIWQESNDEMFISTDLHEGEKLDDYEPVPLTEEWHNKFGVVKNGFGEFEYIISKTQKIVFSGDYIFLRDADKYTGEPSIRDNICTLWSNDIRKRGIAAHEFQNLYHSLTGEELTAK